VQFRPGAELEEQIKTFAAKHDLQVNEACKVLVALAVSSMDVRYYDLINQMAEVMGGVNPFVRACVRVQAALEGAALATGKPLQLEPERSEFIFQVAKDFLSAKGIQVRTEDPWFSVPEQSKLQEERTPGSTNAGRYGRALRSIVTDTADQ
jgi:hypothetical protein